MKKLRVEYKKDEVVVSHDTKRITSRSNDTEDFATFKEWANSYTHAINQYYNNELLLNIGRKMFAWLNGEQNCLIKWLVNAMPPFFIEFQIPHGPSEIQNAFIEAPWELLADDNGHLAKDQNLEFCPIRRIGIENTEKKGPSRYILNTVFMAASPGNVKPELAYEQEENAILNLHADKKIDMDLFVEESGNLVQLTGLINEIKPVDVAHISCHGNIFYDRDSDKSEPCLCLEKLTGDSDQVTPDIFTRTLSQNRPRLVFLSACKTSETYANKESSENEEYNTFTQTIIRRGFPAVLGWSGPVGDSEATRFAAELYRNLSLSATLENAVAKARCSLFAQPREMTEQYESRDWHLARLYLGPDGGGIISDAKSKRFDLDKDAGVKEFLGKKEKELAVASRREFVGRRRQIQDILKEFTEKKHAGVLIHGLGNQGKSSLAARIANRMHNHETVLVYGKENEKRNYSAYQVLNEFKSVSHNTGETEKLIDEFLKEVNQNVSNLKTSLKALLNDAYSGMDDKHKAILLVIDDLEKILTEPQGASNAYGVEEEYRTTMISVIEAFKEARTESRLIITSRYNFTLFDSNDSDIAGKLMNLPLASMNNTEAKKQYFAKYGAGESGSDEIKLEPYRVLKACKGNPGLQDMMFGLFTVAPKDYLKTLVEMESYIEEGSLPEEQELLKFLQDLTIDNILKLLTDGERELLRVAALIEIPVPEGLFVDVKEIVGIQKTVDYKKRLIGFGLLEQFEDIIHPGQKSLLLNNIVKPQVEKLSAEETEGFAGVITKSLLNHWCSDKEMHRPWICDREIVRFGVIAKHEEAVSLCVENCIRGMHDNFLTIEAEVLANRSIDLLESNNRDVPAGLYQIASDVCHMVGNVENSQKYIENAINNSETTEENSFEIASSYLRQGRILIQRGEVEEALKTFEQSKRLFLNAKADREMAIVSGDIARIMVDKGEVDEALKLHQERSQVFDKLGDTRSKAVTLGDIARIMVSKGEVDEALKLHQEMIQVFDKLGDTRSKAVTLGDIARIMVSKGEVDEALKLHQEMIQVFDKLGDTRSKAVTLGDIARIMVSKGEVDEALKLHQEMIQVFDKLGDLRGRATTLLDISRILLQKEDIQKTYEYLAESYQICLKLGQLDGICFVSLELGQLLCQANQRDEGIKILERSQEGLDKLGQKELALQVGEIIEKFKN